MVCVSAVLASVRSRFLMPRVPRWWRNAIAAHFVRGTDIRARCGAERPCGETRQQANGKSPRREEVESNHVEANFFDRKAGIRRNICSINCCRGGEEPTCDLRRLLRRLPSNSVEAELRGARELQDGRLQPL